MTEIDMTQQAGSGVVPIHPMSRRAVSTIVLAWSLAIVLFYFGINEILSPQNWMAFAPGFLGSGNLVIILVIIHGVILISLGAALVLNYYPKIAAALVSAILLEILIELVFQSGFSDIVVRDIGLLGAAVSLFFVSL